MSDEKNEKNEREELLDDYRDSLIDQQPRRLGKTFVESGGLRERMTRARTEYRRAHPA
jgi:four helix bundle suffix protein